MKKHIPTVLLVVACLSLVGAIFYRINDERGPHIDKDKPVKIHEPRTVGE